MKSEEVRGRCDFPFLVVHGDIPVMLSTPTLRPRSREIHHHRRQRRSPSLEPIAVAPGGMGLLAIAFGPKSTARRETREPGRWDRHRVVNVDARTGGEDRDWVAGRDFYRQWDSSLPVAIFVVLQLETPVR